MLCKIIASAFKAVYSPDKTRLVYALGQASRDVSVTTAQQFKRHIDAFRLQNFRLETAEGLNGQQHHTAPLPPSLSMLLQATWPAKVVLETRRCVQ